MYVFDAGRSLTPEEIEEIKHTITPVEKIRSGLIDTGKGIFTERVKGSGARHEDVNKLR